MKNKTKIISIISIILILIIGIVGYFMYQKAEEEKAIQKSLNNITTTETSFSKAETHEEKLNILKSSITEMENYNKSKDHFEQVTNKYKSSISAMQEDFIKEYDSIIEQNTLNNIDSLEDISVITNNKDNLSSLLSTMEAEKDYVFSSNDDFGNYQQKITELTESYTNRIAILEEAKKKAEEEAKRKAEEEARKKAEEEKAKTHYENEYFSVDVPKEWVGYWRVTEEDNSVTGIYGTIFSKVYHFSHKPPIENYGGGADVYVLDMRNTDIPLNVYRGMIPSTPNTSIGQTSGGIDVFNLEVAAGFFFDSGATITLK